MLTNIKVKLHFLLPKNLSTILLGWLANQQGGWITKITINMFIWYYKINMEEAVETNIEKYKTFNDFFSRNLKKETRPYDFNPNNLIQAAEGRISQLGYIQKNHILQAKGHYYSLESLLAGNYELANQFYNGNFITTYITPGDYHRVHMPCDGKLVEMIYVPGSLFSVNPIIVDNIPNLFARNERVICIFNTIFGPIAQILIGAVIVGSIEIIGEGQITPPREGIIKRWNLKNSNISFCKGEEIGFFKMGSTVINLFPPKKIEFLKELKPGIKILSRQKLAWIRKDEI